LSESDEEDMKNVTRLILIKEKLQKSVSLVDQLSHNVRFFFIINFLLIINENLSYSINNSRYYFSLHLIRSSIHLNEKLSIFKRLSFLKIQSFD
jgi:hypothetical protein